MKRRRETKCAFCDTPTRVTVQTRENRRTTFICDAAKCWDRYYASLTPATGARA